MPGLLLRALEGNVEADLDNSVVRTERRLAHRRPPRNGCKARRSPRDHLRRQSRHTSDAVPGRRRRPAGGSRPRRPPSCPRAWRLRIGGRKRASGRRSRHAEGSRRPLSHPCPRLGLAHRRLPEKPVRSRAAGRWRARDPRREPAVVMPRAAETTIRVLALRLWSRAQHFCGIGRLRRKNSYVRQPAPWVRPVPQAPRGAKR